MYTASKQARRAMAYLICGVMLVLANVLFMWRIASAAPAYTPYANSVNAQSGISIGNPQNAIGAPDGNTGGLLGINDSLTLDMGDGEQGTQALRIYYGPIGLQGQVRVDFLDDSSNVLKSDTQTLFLNLGGSAQNYNFNWQDYGKGYRFVKLTNLAGIGLNVDALEALGYVGSTATQDTDGDGIPDRTDTRPLVFDTPPSNNGGGNGGNGGGGNGNTGGGGASTGGGLIRTIGTANGPNTGGTGGSSTQVNPPPSPEQDLDGDQMLDQWERDYGLNPSDPADAKKDLDNDGLSNLLEYQLGSNPSKPDSDADGIADKWEYDHGLNLIKNDSSEDPDGDYITNLGEAAFNTNPFQADLSAFCKAVDKANGSNISVWDWLVFGLLLILALLSFIAGWLLAAATPPVSKSSWFYRLHHRLYKAFWPGHKK